VISCFTGLDDAETSRTHSDTAAYEAVKSATPLNDLAASKKKRSGPWLDVRLLNQSRAKQKLVAINRKEMIVYKAVLGEFYCAPEERYALRSLSVLVTSCSRSQRDGHREKIGQQ